MAWLKGQDSIPNAQPPSSPRSLKHIPKPCMNFPKWRTQAWWRRTARLIRRLLLLCAWQNVNKRKLLLSPSTMHFFYVCCLLSFPTGRCSKFSRGFHFFFFALMWPASSYFVNIPLMGSTSTTFYFEFLFSNSYLYLLPVNVITSCLFFNFSGWRLTEKFLLLGAS